MSSHVVQLEWAFWRQRAPSTWPWIIVIGIVWICLSRSTITVPMSLYQSYWIFRSIYFKIPTYDCDEFQIINVRLSSDNQESYVSTYYEVEWNRLLRRRHWPIAKTIVAHDYKSKRKITSMNGFEKMKSTIQPKIVSRIETCAILSDQITNFRHSDIKKIIWSDCIQYTDMRIRHVSQCWAKLRAPWTCLLAHLIWN